MKKRESRYVIIEFNRFHDEVIFPQVLALTSHGKEYRLLGNSALLRYGLLKNDENFISLKSGKGLNKIWNIIFALLYVRSNDIIVLNSADWKLSLLFIGLTRSKNIFSIVHNGKRLYDPRYKNLLKKSRKIIVLSDYISGTLTKSGIESVSYYPLLKPDYFDLPVNNNQYKIISIPGVIVFSKRDYNSVLTWARKHKSILRGICKIELLGNINSTDGQAVKKFIKQNSLEDLFILHNEFIPYRTFLARISAADFLLPLIHPKAYGQYKITAVFNYAMGFDKPLILENGFKDIPGIYSRKIYYGSLDEITENLVSSSAPDFDDRIERDFQKEYINILNSE